MLQTFIRPCLIADTVPPNPSVPVTSDSAFWNHTALPKCTADALRILPLISTLADPCCAGYMGDWDGHRGVSWRRGQQSQVHSSFSRAASNLVVLCCCNSPGVCLELTFSGPAGSRAFVASRTAHRRTWPSGPSGPPKPPWNWCECSLVATDAVLLLPGAYAPTRKNAGWLTPPGQSGLTGWDWQEGGKWPDKAAECVFRDDHALRLYQREGVNWLVFNWCACLPRWPYPRSARAAFSQRRCALAKLGAGHWFCLWQ